MSYDFWRDALAGKAVLVHEDQPQNGFYRMRDGKGGPWLPVAIFEHEGVQTARVGSEVRGPKTIWTWCAGNPVSQADAKYAFEHGSWPGDVPDVPTIGDNSGALSLQDEIGDAISQVNAWLKSIDGTITTDVEMDMAANHKDRLNALRSKAEAQHKIEKAPHLEAGRAVDGAWKPAIQNAKSTSDQLRDHLTKYMRKKEAEERRKAEEAARKEREAQERERQKAIEEAKAQGASEQEAEASAPEPEDLPLAPAPVKVQAGGQRGKRTALRTRKVATITDYEKALKHFATHLQVTTLIEKLAQHAVKDGHEVPGVTVTEEMYAA